MDSRIAQLNQLKEEHDRLCDNFKKEISELCKEIETISRPLGVYPARTILYENSREVTRLLFFNDTRADFNGNSLHEEPNPEILKDLEGYQNK